LFALQRGCCRLPPSRHCVRFNAPRGQQTVDDLNAALEIESRSSYVPSSLIGVRSRPVPEDARLNAAPLARLEMPIWMK
jgi:hypothetical protein